MRGEGRRREEEEEEDEEEEFITGNDWRGKHNSLLRGAGRSLVNMRRRRRRGGGVYSESYTRKARFLTRWDQRTVAQRRRMAISSF